MLTAARLREYTGAAGVLELLRDLGYPVAPIDVDPEEWRRGGVEIPWNGEGRLRLVSRFRHFDLFLLDGDVADEMVAKFLHSYRSYNIMTKSSVVRVVNSRDVTLFDLASSQSLRKLQVDLAQPTTHAVDRLNLLACGEEASLPRIFDRALDREGVTRHFFERFRTAVAAVAGALASLLPAEPREAVEGEALLILSRLLFLSFVQEKGWLNGERRFLTDRLESEIRQGGNFFTGVLTPLFFGCLNTPLHERSLSARKLGRIPYLNGGLFEPSSFETRHPGIALPNALMQQVLEEVFERFDFSIEEAGAQGTRVDPEMLGKVFESLMAVDERTASGSFYTPREVVDTLTERAITSWLGPEVPSDPARAAELLRKLETITVLDPACGSGAFLLSALGAIERRWRALAGAAGIEVPHDVRRRIVARSLYGVDLKPEAVRLCELRLWLAIVSVSQATADTVEPLPNLDRNILQGNSLFSPTDFLGDARTGIYAEWLHALRAQRDLLERYSSASHGQRPALYRIIRGNDQRLAAELLSRSIDAAERELEIACTPQRDLFGEPVAIDVKLCTKLQERIAESRRMLERLEEGTLDFFSFDIHFAHVMSAGGFAIVAGNPPWVRNSRIDARTKRMLADRYPLFRGARDGTPFHQPDLSTAFFDRALNLAAPDGVVALLMPSKIANAAYAGRLRRAAMERTRIVAIDDWSDDPRRRRWFDADTFPLGIVMSRSTGDPRCENRGEDGGELPAVEVRAAGETFEMRQTDLAIGGPLSEWALIPPGAAAILRRLRHSHQSVEQVLGRRPFMGVKTGDNQSFFLQAETIRGGNLITADGIPVPLSAVARCVRGRELRRWAVDSSTWMLWPPRCGWAKPPRWLMRLAEARGMEPQDFRLSFVRPEHVGIKVAWKDLSRGLAAAVLPDVVHVMEQQVPLVPNQTLYAIDAVSTDEAYAIAAVLNSTVAGALLVSVAERAKDAHYRYFGRTIAEMPLPDLRERFDDLVRLSRRAHRGVDVSDDLDRVVASLYGVSASELEMLRSLLGRRLGAR
jgi:hypothetical protein